jgi:hypothetical protein
MWPVDVGRRKLGRVVPDLGIMLRGVAAPPHRLVGHVNSRPSTGSRRGGASTLARGRSQAAAWLSTWLPPRGCGETGTRSRPSATDTSWPQWGKCDAVCLGRADRGGGRWSGLFARTGVGDAAIGNAREERGSARRRQAGLQRGARFGHGAAPLFQGGGPAVATAGTGHRHERDDVCRDAADRRRRRSRRRLHARSMQCLPDCAWRCSTRAASARRQMAVSRHTGLRRGG